MILKKIEILNFIRVIKLLQIKEFSILPKIYMNLKKKIIF